MTLHLTFCEPVPPTVAERALCVAAVGYRDELRKPREEWTEQSWRTAARFFSAVENYERAVGGCGDAAAEVAEAVAIEGIRT